MVKRNGTQIVSIQGLFINAIGSTTKIRKDVKHQILKKAISRRNSLKLIIE